MGRKLISFDWAIKKVLRSRVNFGILEGFLSVVLNEDLKIVEILDAEGDKETEDDKSNRVDIKVRDKNDQIIIIEVQFTREYDYLNRILYGTSKVIKEHINEGDSYKNVVKVISINILFMSLGEGDDYVYHGKTTFKGIHTDSILRLTKKEKEVLQAETIEDCYPEYFIIDVSNFNNLAKNSLDEWIYFLKNEEIKDNFTAPGLADAKKKFNILAMDKARRIQYDRYIDTRRREFSRYESSHLDGVVEGREEGRAEGREEERRIQEDRRSVELADRQKMLSEKDSVINAALELLIAHGMNRDEAKKRLGIDD